MVDQPLIVLVGDSLLMDGVAAGLANSQMPRFERIDRECFDLQGRLKTLEPDLVVFEIDHPTAQSIGSLLRAQSNLLLIGLDMESCQAIVMKSHLHLTQSIEDLCRLLQDEVHPVPHT